MTAFIPPRYGVPISADGGQCSLEWYKFFVPLARGAVPATREISTTAPLSGGNTLADDITISLLASGVTNAFLAQMATHTLKGNSTSGTANPTDLSATDVTALLNAFTAGLKGLAPASGGGLSNFLRSDGTWASSVDASLSAGTYLRSGSVLVAALPAAATVGAGARMVVTDATVTTFASVVAGLGGNTVPVYSDGTNWRIG